MTTFLAYVAWLRKGVVTVLGVIAQLISLGVLSGSALHWAQIIIAAATAVGVISIPNAARPAARAPHDPTHAV